MINVNSLLIFCQTLANADQTGANITSVQFNSILPESVYELIRTYFGAPKIQPSRPLLTFEKNQVIKDYLTPTLKTKRLTPVDGIVSLPANYMHLADASYEYYKVIQVVCSHCGTCECNGSSCNPCNAGKKGKKNKQRTENKKTLVPITIVNSSQWSNLFQDDLNYPTSEEPYGTFIGEENGFVQLEVAPQTIPQVILKYVKLNDPEPTWGFTSSNGFDVYDPSTSVQIDLPRELLQELAWIVLEMIGIHTREYWLAQEGQQKVISGV